MFNNFNLNPKVDKMMPYSYRKIVQKNPFYENGPTIEKKEKPLPGTQQGRAQNLGQKQVFPKRLGSNF